MGQVTRIDRKVTELPPGEETPVEEGRGDYSYGETAYAKQADQSSKVSAQAAERGNPILLRESVELTPKEDEGIFSDIGILGDAIKRHAPASSSREELQANIAKDVNSKLVRMALDEFKKQIHKD